MSTNKKVGKVGRPKDTGNVEVSLQDLVDSLADGVKVPVKYSWYQKNIVENNTNVAQEESEEDSNVPTTPVPPVQSNKNKSNKKSTPKSSQEDEEESGVEIALTV